MVLALLGIVIPPWKKVSAWGCWRLVDDVGFSGCKHDGNGEVLGTAAGRRAAFAALMFRYSEIQPVPSASPRDMKSTESPRYASDRPTGRW